MKVGFSLIELVIVMLLTAILGLFLATAISNGVDAWYFVMDKNELMTQTPYSLNRIARELRQIKDLKSVYAASSNSITFTDTNSVSITYNLSSNTVYRNSNVLIDGVTSFSLLYYDANGNIIASPVVNPANTNIRRIKVSITTQKGSNSLSMETIVRPRNLSLVGAQN